MPTPRIPIPMPEIEADDRRGGSPTRPSPDDPTMSRQSRQKPDLEKYSRRKSPRWQGFDYSRGGAYFVTICVNDRRKVLSEIINGEVRLLEAGKIVREAWLSTPEYEADVQIDEFVIMPDHFHGILWIEERAGQGPAPTTLPSVMRRFKSLTANRANKSCNSSGTAFWQRSYHDRVIRNDTELARIREYIRRNPQITDSPEPWLDT